MTFHENEKQARFLKPSIIALKKKKVLYVNQSYDDDEEDSKKPKKKVITIIPREANKEELKLRKRKFEEFKLQNVCFLLNLFEYKQ